MPGPSTPRTWLVAATLLVVTTASLGAPGPTISGQGGATGKGATEPAPITLSAPTVPATGAHHVHIEVDRFGRYALSATSAQGTAVQLVDRMAGPGEVAGVAGSANGRIDAFLERGEYRLRTISDRAGSGEARVEARPFVEVNGGKPPLLPDLAMVTTTLADLEQRSWWVQVDADEDFAVELAGRSLADVRLWRDGQWLDPAAPACEDIAPDAARPLRRCALTTRLGAGLWQLVAYGGVAAPWTVPDGDQPLHVRRGLATLPVASRLAGTMGPFGAERWLVPGKATSYRLELPSGADARLAVRTLDATDPFRRDGTGAGIRKETMPPLAEVDVDTIAEGRVVTVSGAAGQPFVLQVFPRAARTIPVTGAGTFFLTTLHAGDPGDLPDVTAVLTEVRKADEPPPAPIATSLLPLGPDMPYRRKFNLLGTTSLWFDVATEAEYHVAVAGVGAGWRWEPLLTSVPAGYAPPAFREGPGATKLTPGRWSLTLSPKTPGIAEVAVRRDPMTKLTPTPPRANVQLAAITLDGSKRYTLTLAEVAGARAGMVLRALPADLVDPLPITLRPGESVTVPTVANAAGTVAAGAGLEISVDGGAWAASVNVRTGGHTVAVRNPGAAVLQGAVALVPDDRRPGAPLPPLPDTAVTTPPDLPLLSTKAARALDLGEEDTATYRLQVERAGLYRAESTGLLATAGAVRTRTNPVLEAAAVNGVGRNFLLQRYLREGDYQLTVATQGSSAGHLGLRLVPTALRDGGALRDGVPARATVPAGEGIAYRYEVAEAGEYVLRSFGQGRLFRVRVEDDDGWPLLAPDVDGDLRLDLPAGSGRILVLPEVIETTRITTLTHVPPRLARLGHGPHPLPLDAAATHVWWEPPAREDRAPDVWTFALRAPADVTIAADAEMTGDVLRGGPSRDGAHQDGPVARLVPGRPWTGRLDAGDYRLELVNARRNSGVTYTVRVSPRELVPGLSRDVTAPASLPVSVGADGLVELTSMGVSDVRARLYDATGRLVVAADDRPDDWNFRVAERLAPGPYRLQVDPVGASAGRTTVTYALAHEVDGPPLSAGQSRTATLGANVTRVPLQVPASGEGLLVVSARSTENVALAVESYDGTTWRTVGRASGPEARVVVRLGAPDRRYRLRLESLDRRGVPTTVRVDVVTPKRVGEAAFAGGAAVPTDTATGLAAVVVARDRAGLVELATRVGLAWCPTAGEACEPVPGAVLGGAEADVWLVAERAGKARGVSIRGVRHVLGSAPVRASLRARTSAMAKAGAGSEKAGGLGVPLDLPATDAPVLLIARADAAQPTLSLPIDVAPGAAVTVAFGPGDLHVYAEAADPSALVEVDLARRVFPTPTAGAFVADAASATLDPGTAWRAPLPEGTHGARIVLAEGLVAVFSEAGRPVEIVWASDGPRDLALAFQADTLTVLNPTAKGAAWSAVVTDTPPGRARTAGRTRVSLPGNVGAFVHVRGAVRDVVGVTDGVVRGRDVPLGPAPGWIEVTHDGGAWAMWTDAHAASEGEAAGLWGGPPPAAPKAASRAATALPASVALNQAVVAVRVDAPGAGILRVRAGQPVIALVRHDGGKARAHLLDDGALDVPVGAAHAVEVALRAPHDSVLSGTARVDFVAAVPLAEGLGPEALLGAHMSRAYTFRVDRRGPVGVGFRTDAAALDVALHGSDGATIATGVAMMPTLDPGAYLLTATLPADAAPARLRPALVGLTPPDTGPPEEVIRAYLVAAGLIPPAPATPADAEESQ